MPNFITSLDRAIARRRPQWPFCLNKDSLQSKGLIAWWPLGYRDIGLDLGPFGDDLSNQGATKTTDPEMGQVVAFDDASTQYLGVANQRLTAYPFTFTTIANTDTVALTHAAALSISHNNRWNDYCDLGVGLNDAEIFINNATSPQILQVTNTVSVDTWHFYCGVFTSSTLYVYLDESGNSAANTISFSVNWIEYAIGVQPRKTPRDYWSGMIADARVYDYAVPVSLKDAMYDPKTRWELWYEIGRISYFPQEAAGPPTEAFFENRHPIELGMKPQTAAGMGGVLVA
jgi:hypothetical protein